MLRDPYYIGFVTYKGQVLPGRHEPIIDRTLFARVQDVLAARSSGGQRDRILTHHLKGMVLCGRCKAVGRESRLIYTEAMGRNGQLYEYFVCRGRQEGFCDLPHLAAAQVEQAIESHYDTLTLEAEYIDAMLAHIDAAMADQQENTRFLHETLTKQLARIDVQEDRLVELAADGTMPQARIRTKLNRLAVDRKRIEEGLARSGDELQVGADLLKVALMLSAEPGRLYGRVSDESRRAINETFFERFYVEDHGLVTEAPLRPPFDEIAIAHAAYISDLPYAWKTPQGALGRPVTSEFTKTVSRTIADRDDLVSVSSKTGLVGNEGLEPPTPSV